MPEHVKPTEQYLLQPLRRTTFVVLATEPTLHLLGLIL